MQINNNYLSNFNFKKDTTVNEKKAQSISQDTITSMPDIKLSQILLPNKQIYLPQGTKPATFNKNNISIELPANYKKATSDEESQMTKTARVTFKKAKVNQYQNTTTGAKIIRITQNIFSEEGALNSAEVFEINAKNIRKGTRYIKDFEHNTETEIKVTNPLRPKLTTTDEITTIHKDKNGKVIKIEEYKKSCLKGIYDIYETDAFGNKTVVSKATKKADGSIILEKNLVSLDGTKTQYIYKSDESGNHKKMFCQISDKEGNILSTIDRTYDRENEEVAYSSVNGNKYKIEKNTEGVEITNYTTGEKTEIKASKFNSSDDTKYFLKTAGAKGRFSEENVVDEMFRTLPADTLLTLNNNIKEIIPLEDDLDSAFMGVFDYLMCKTDNFVINHELGHSMDSVRLKEDANILEISPKNTTTISNKTNFYKAYVEEKAAFIKEFPHFEEKFISYFIENTAKRTDRGRSETVAESNAINGLSPEVPEKLAMRTTLLQRYFPRSIAELTKMMNNIAINNN